MSLGDEQASACGSVGETMNTVWQGRTAPGTLSWHSCLPGTAMWQSDYALCDRPRITTTLLRDKRKALHGSPTTTDTAHIESIPPECAVARSTRHSAVSTAGRPYGWISWWSVAPAATTACTEPAQAPDGRDFRIARRGVRSCGRRGTGGRDGGSLTIHWEVSDHHDREHSGRAGARRVRAKCEHHGTSNRDRTGNNRSHRKPRS